MKWSDLLPTAAQRSKNGVGAIVAPLRHAVSEPIRRQQTKREEPK